MKSRRVAFVAVVTWLVVVAVAAWIVAHARFTADLSAFLPTRPTPEQSLLIEQLREGPASHLILVAIDGGSGAQAVDAATLAKLSRATAGALRGDARFLSVNNGEVIGAANDRAFLFDHRYLLSDQVTAERFTVAGLHAALDDSLDLLSSSAGLMLQPLIARDPTAELVHLVEALSAGRDLPTVDGTWVTRAASGDVHALVIAETRAEGSDIDGQQVAIDALRAAFDGAQRSVGPSAARARLVLSGPPVFAVDARNTIEREAKHLSTIGLVLVSLLLGFVYRSARALVLGLIPMATGALVGLAAVEVGFGLVHGIALGFGVTLIGEAVDYAIYLFVQRPTDGRSRFWRTIALGVGTSAIGFAALLFSGFQGLAQIGLLSIVGLVVAAAVTRWVLPALLPAGFEVRALPRVGAVLQRAADGAARLRWPALVIAAAACVVVFVHRDHLWSRELGSLSPLPIEAQRTDESLRGELGAPDVRDLVIVAASNREDALRGSEAVVDTMRPLVADGTLLGLEAPSNYLPSQATQRRRQAALPDDATLRRDFQAALEGLPFTKTSFESFYADVGREKTTALLDDGDLAKTSLAPALRALLGTHTDESGKPRWTAVVALRSPPNADIPRDRIATDLAKLDGLGDARIRLVDIMRETQNIYAGYLSEAVRMAGIGALGIVVLLAIALRDARRLARVVAPLALAVILVAAGHVAWGGLLNLFHLIGLLLIVGVGSNYALFFDRRAHAAAGEDGDDRHVLVSLVVANFTAVIGFGVLALSSLPVLNSIGTTVAPGALLGLVLSAVFARRVTDPRRAGVIVKRRAAGLVIAATLAGCATRPATLPVQWIEARCARPVDTLLVLLPGAFDRAQDFIGEGFVDAVRAQDIAADIALVDASVPFYQDRDVVARLEADVVAPARARGIRHLWFAGISIGGLGSLIYSEQKRGSVDGLLLIAPYLGTRPITAEVAASGGLSRWAPPGTIPPDDDDRQIWQWLKKLATAPPGVDVPPVWLGYGVDDRFADAHRLFAAALPADRVFTAPGGHDWPAWRDVWPRMLAAAPLPRGCNAALTKP